MASAQVRAQKGRGIEEVIEDLTPQIIEEQRTAPMGTSNKVTWLVEKYKEFASQRSLYHNPSDSWAAVNENALFLKLHTVKAVLSPLEINAFLQVAALDYNEEDKKEVDMLGRFTSWLIQNSYRAGYTQFNLNTQNLQAKVSGIGWRVQGTEEHPLHIFIDGDAGKDLGKEARHVMFTLNGDIVCEREPSWGIKAEYCLFVLYETVRVPPERQPRWQTFFVEYPPEKGPKNCVFKTANESMMEDLTNCLPPTNILIFVGKDGAERIVRDYK